MADHQHYEGCYRHHFVCAQEYIRELERRLSQNGNTCTQSGNVLTHATFIPCGEWYTHHGDEPPSATV